MSAVVVVAAAAAAAAVVVGKRIRNELQAGDESSEDTFWRMEEMNTIRERKTKSEKK